MVFLKLKILQKSELENTKCNSYSKFARSDLMEKIIKNYRGVKKML